MNQYKLPDQLVVNYITQTLKQINKQGTIDNTCFDLSAVTNIDSAGIAFLAYLKSNYTNTQFINTNHKINNLCQLYKIQL